MATGLLRVAACCSVALLTTRAGFAQAPIVRGAILGTVTDTGLVPVPDVNVEVIGAGAKVNTDASGRFRINSVPAGEFLFFVRRIGFHPVSSLIHVEAGDTLRLAFTLEPSVNALNTVTVTEHARSAKMREFDERRRGGFGEFMDQAQIEKLNFVDMIGVMRTFKAVRMQGGAPESARHPIGTAPCQMMVYLDGIPRGADVGDLPSPKQIAGIEVYAGPATTPLWLPTGGQNGRGGKRFCGVILIWTRDGS